MIGAGLVASGIISTAGSKSCVILAFIWAWIVAQFGHNKQAKVCCPKSAKWAVLFGDELSEEFKEKATTIFEAAIAGRLAEERAALEEEYAAKKTELERIIC